MTFTSARRGHSNPHLANIGKKKKPNERKRSVPVAPVRGKSFCVIFNFINDRQLRGFLLCRLQQACATSRGIADRAEGRARRFVVVAIDLSEGNFCHYLLYVSNVSRRNSRRRIGPGVQMAEAKSLKNPPRRIWHPWGSPPQGKSLQVARRGYLFRGS